MTHSGLEGMYVCVSSKFDMWFILFIDIRYEISCRAEPYLQQDMMLSVGLFFFHICSLR